MKTDPGLIEGGEGWWGLEEQSYQFFGYSVVQALGSMFGEWALTGACAINSMVTLGEQRLSSGVDVVVPKSDLKKVVSDPLRFAGRLNQVIEKNVHPETLELHPAANISLGMFDFMESSDEYVSFICTVKGGHLFLKDTVRCSPNLLPKYSFIEGNAKLLNQRISPFFLKIRFKAVETKPERPLTEGIIHKGRFVNYASTKKGLSPLSVNVPNPEVLLASKLNMIFQSSINQGLIRSTPLSMHYSMRYGRKRVFGGDLYDLLVLSTRCNLAEIKPILEQMVTEPVNAMLDRTIEAIKLMSSLRLYVDLNPLLPGNLSVDSTKWKQYCDQAIGIVKRIRES